MSGWVKNCLVVACIPLRFRQILLLLSFVLALLLSSFLSLLLFHLLCRDNLGALLFPCGSASPSSSLHSTAFTDWHLSLPSMFFPSHLLSSVTSFLHCTQCDPSNTLPVLTFSHLNSNQTLHLVNSIHSEYIRQLFFHVQAIRPPRWTTSMSQT